MPLDPTRTCPETLTIGRRKGDVCGRMAAADGYCDNHGPGGRLAQDREARARARTEGICQHVLAKGKRAGEVCGGRTVPGKAVCARHDPSTYATRAANRAGGANRCKAISGKTKERCTEGAMPGLDVCSRHGGSTPQAKAKSAQYAAEQKARTTLAGMGVDVRPVINAYEALQYHAGIVVAWRDACWDMLEELDPSQFRYKSQADLEQIRGEVLLWERSMVEATNTLTKLSRVQVEEKLVAIEEKKADMIMDAFAKALSVVMRMAQVTGKDVENAAWAEFSKRLKVIPGAVERPELPEAV